jgi:hypothetical protein
MLKTDTPTEPFETHQLQIILNWFDKKCAYLFLQIVGQTETFLNKL